jgi:tRNA threonylcarbamoyl adenosine modification protein YeaZ
MTRTDLDNILAIDSATRRLNLALLYGGDRSVQSGETMAKTHGQVIIKKIEELFQSADLDISDLQAVVVTVGPGSFTGLRIGLAAAKGIAVVGDLPMVGVSLFEIAAKKLSPTARAFVLIPSRRSEFYIGTIVNGVFDGDNSGVISEADLPEQLGTDPTYGVDFDPRAVLTPSPANLIREQLKYGGNDALQVGLEKLRRGEIADLARLEPAYLQKTIAEVRFDQRQGDR